jgi:predicted nucleic acid-binding protein
MNSLVLIDSSVWVEVSRKDGNEALKEEVAGLLRTSRTAMTWPVWVELHQGAKGRREEENLRGWRELSRWLEFDDDCWTRAATTARTCLRTGVSVPFGDILIGGRESEPPPHPRRKFTNSNKTCSSGSFVGTSR